MRNNEKATRLCNDRRMGSSIPKFLCCPLSGKLMKDPVKTDSGITYDRSSIEEWISNGNLHCSITGKQISHNLLRHTKLASDISEWKKLYPQIRDASQNELQWLLQHIKIQDYRCHTFLNNITRLRCLIQKQEWPPQDLQKFRPGDVLAAKLSSMSIPHIEDSDTNEAAEEIICVFKYVDIDITTVKKMLTPNALTIVSFVLRNSRLKRRIEAMQLINRVIIACEELFVDQIVSVTVSVIVESIIKGLLEIVDCPFVDSNDKYCAMITLRRLCRRGEERRA